MKAFNFPLESLRTLRQQKERAAQQRYAHALALCEEAMRAVELAEEELRAARVMLLGELEGGVAASRIVHLRSWCSAMEARRGERLAALSAARRETDDSFRLMTAAVREREALDRFHDKSQRLWQRAYQAEEQKTFDELAVQRQSTAGLEKTHVLN